MRVTIRALTIALAAGLMAACAAPPNAYIQDAETGTSFAVPREWLIAELQPDQDTPSEFAIDEGLMLYRGFAPPDGELAGFPVGAHPTGLVRVRALSPEEQETASIRSLRNAVWDIDGLRESDPNAVKVIEEILITSEGGFHGERIVASLETTPEGTTQPVAITINQTSLLDPFSSTEYVFVIACTVECYDANRATIDQIVSTWKVVPR